MYVALAVPANKLAWCVIGPVQGVAFSAVSVQLLGYCFLHRVLARLLLVVLLQIGQLIGQVKDLCQRKLNISCVSKASKP